MKRKITTLLLSFFIGFAAGYMSTGSKLKLSPEFDGVDKRAESYIEEFKLLSKGTVTDEDFYDVTVGFGDIKGTAVGTCWITPWFREIKIDKSWWYYAGRTPLEKEELMFHELGHCILFRMHTDEGSTGPLGWLEDLMFEVGIIKRHGYLKDGCPTSFMHPYTIDNSCIKKHYEHYMEELFDYIEEEETVSEEIIIEYEGRSKLFVEPS